MKLILQCSSNNDFSDDLCAYATWEDWYAMLDLTPEDASLMLRRIASFGVLKQSDPALHEIYYMDGVSSKVVYFDQYAGKNADDEALQDLIESLYLSGSDPWIVPDDTPTPKPERTECDQTIVRESEIEFYCNPKHSNVQVNTCPIPNQSGRIPVRSV